MTLATFSPLFLFSPTSRLLFHLHFSFSLITFGKVMKENRILSQNSPKNDGQTAIIQTEIKRASSKASQYLHFCTSLVEREVDERQNQCTQLLRCQHLYFCTSKASGFLIFQIPDFANPLYPTPFPTRARARSGKRVTVTSGVCDTAPGCY